MGIFDIFSNADSQDAANAQKEAYTKALNDMAQQTQQGNQALTTNYNAALQPLTANTNTAQAGWGMYGNALGLNGPQGSQTAVDAFKANPGYQFGLNQGLDAVMARMAQTGQLASGNTDLALQKFGQDYANTNWNNWLQTLAPYGNQALTAGNAQAQTQVGLGTELNKNAVGLGNAAYGADVGQGNAQAQADYANLAASGNIWNAIAGVAGGALKGGGMASGGAPGWTQALGNIASSDIRLKRDIHRLAVRPDGIEVYRFRYKHRTETYIGVMAQQVAQIRPDAIRMIKGFLGVDYAALGMRLVKLEAI